MKELDKNMVVASDIKEKDVVFYNVKNYPFGIYGIYDKEIGKPFTRMNTEYAKKVSESVYNISYWTAGGRIRFKTDSDYVVVSLIYNGKNSKWPQMSGTAVNGCDIYEKIDGKDAYVGTFIPPVDSEGTYQQIVYFNGKGMHDVTVHMPIYARVDEFYIGLKQTASLSEGSKYINDKPVVFYGSSITQGGCMSRPGNNYENILSRTYNIDHHNLGFAGNAKGEKEMAEYIADLSMSIFVYDYDYNTPSIEHLEKTHENMFKIIRNKNPELPIIIMTAVSGKDREYMLKRRDIIKKTYDNAVNIGDKNVYFIDGSVVFEKYGYAWNEPTLEGTHPTDLGFSLMAKAVGEVLEKIMTKTK